MQYLCNIIAKNMKLSYINKMLKHKSNHTTKTTNYMWKKSEVWQEMGVKTLLVITASCWWKILRNVSGVCYSEKS